MLHKKIGLFLAPLAFVILLMIPAPEPLSSEAWKVLALAAFMLIWWVTEAVPLAVAALLPMILLPMLGVQDMKTAAAPYANPIVFLFMGGFMLAVAMERWNLHRRIALNIVRLVGTNANRIVLGFMLATALLSMWISNTATTIMMLPIATSVIQLLTKDTAQYPEKGIRNFALTLMLGIAYAANIGGTATLIGTPPNVVFAGFMSETYNLEISFATWMLMALPLAAVLLMITYFVNVRLLFPNHLGRFSGAADLIKREVDRLGTLSVGEQRTLIVFVCTALAWIFRRQLNTLLPEPVLSDAGIALIATVALFVIPTNFDKNEYIIEWKDTAKLAWGILLLFGGGLSLAAALADVGLIELVGKQFVGLQDASLLVIIGLAAISLFLTEIMSNVALVTVFLPVVAGIADAADIAPLEVTIPVTLAASYAFMLPMSTPPNAIVFASGKLSVSSMVRAGIILNLIAILLISLVAYWVLPLLF